ncbi:MAG: L-glutamate gamma-semialdehyde dehydrogenase [Treponema sp.]|nr:L-glutamate gamma-semialdehyde dehydrogenase [Treponema sp.]
MSVRLYTVPKPINEHVLSYAPGSNERKRLKEEIERQSKMVVEIPLIIAGKEIHTEKKIQLTKPHNHKHVIANVSIAGEHELKLSVEAAKQAKADWSDMPFEHRASIFLKAAELISTKYRAFLNAATMLGQSKTSYQAEIDSACELADFLRFNVYFAESIYREQPFNEQGIWNRTDFRPLEGFIVAITPFNFTAIGGNLCSAPALMGNTVVWKPSNTSSLSNYFIMKIFIEAGLPDGVINFVPCEGSNASKYLLTDTDLGGVHFTGSTGVFNTIWKNIGNNIERYRSYPRLVGELGGKNFVFAHSSTDIDTLVVALVRGAFEYQGQKCSAASRAYIPASIWDEVKTKLLAEIEKIKIGEIEDFTNFMGAVIDEKAFDRITSYIDEARKSDDTEVLCGNYDKTTGWFISPTVILTKNPNYRTMKDELFGPVLTIYIYEDKDFLDALVYCNTGSNYALTGAIFAKDRKVITYMEKALSSAAGNFYINDKPTGAVVGQQPFGGSRSSGTNDKAGSALNLYRWTCLRTIKETFTAPTRVEYPFMSKEDI